MHMFRDPPPMSDLRQRFLVRGFDLVSAARVGAYNDQVAPPFRLPDFGRPESMVALVGNTRRGWSAFLSAMALDASLEPSVHPFDSWVEQSVDDALASWQGEVRIRYAHGGPKGQVDMQRLAHTTGMGFLGPSHLSVHPQFGPWVSFRAAIVLDVRLDTPGVSAIDTCAGCANRPCLVKLADATDAASAPTQEDVKSHWEAWLDVRRACPVGREYAFSRAQSAYHYTHDKKWLKGAS